MTPAAKSLLLKAQDHIAIAKRSIDDANQHDIVGYNLAQAAECYLKALCVLRDLEYPTDADGHDLDALMTLLEEDNLAAVSSHADVIELNRYNSLSARVAKEDRLDLYEYCGRVEDMKTLFQ